MNNLDVNQTFREMFTTKDTGFLPVTPVGLVASVYKNGSLVQTTAGVTLSIDHDGIVGSHQVTVVTTDGFYVNVSDYWIVLTTGTSGGISVIGDIIGRFSIANRNTDSDITKINGSAAEAVKLGRVYEGAIEDYLNGTHTINTIELFHNNTTADSLIGSSLIFDSASSLGNGVSRNVIAYDGTKVTVDEDFPGIPLDNDLVMFFPSGNPKVGTVDANIVSIDGSSSAATHLSLWMDTIVTGYINEVTPPTNGFEVVLANSAFVTQGQMLIMQDSSSLGVGEARIISSDINTSGPITLDKALRAAPAQADAFIILPAAMGDDLLRLNTELASAPGITSGLRDAIKWIFTVSRNRITETSVLQTIRNDANSADIATRTMSDNGTTFDSGKAT